MYPCPRLLFTPSVSSGGLFLSFYRTSVRYNGSRAVLCSYRVFHAMASFCAYPAWYIFPRWRRSRAPTGPPLGRLIYGRRSALLSAIHLRPALASPLVSCGRGVFYLIISSHPPSRYSSASAHLVSSPVLNIAGRWASRLGFVSCLVPASFRIASFHQMKGKQARRGVKSSGSPRRSITSSMRQACHPRLVRRLGLSCRRASRIVPSGRLVRLIRRRASKQDDGAGRSRVLVSSSRLVIRAVGRVVLGPSFRHRLIPSSPASKQAGGGRTVSWHGRRSRSLVPPGRS